MQNFYLKSKEILKDSLYLLLSYLYWPISIQECPGTLALSCTLFLIKYA
jgi:hypothetical protein